MHLSGDAGIERMESALSETRSRYIRVKDSGSPVGFPMTQYMSPSPTPVTTIASTSESNISNKSNKTSRVLSTTAEKIVAPNDVLVNEFLHEHHRSFADDFDVSDHIQNSIEGKIKQTMEKAFWDSVMESVKQDQPNYDQIIQLMEEVRDEICEMAPISWKDDIIAAIDLDILSQVLKSGKLDVNYLGKILEFSLVSLQKLSAPANEEIIKAKHKALL
ncbi:T-complex protein 11, partial [Trifolium pratense]